VNYPDALAELKQADPILAELIERVGLCTLQENQRTGDLLFSLAESILHQQLSTKVAFIIHQRFLQLYPSFPTALDILNTADEDLRAVGISRPKILYLKDLAQKILDGLPTLEDLEPWEDEAIIQTLTQVKGIGRWDVLPVDDLGIQTGIRRIYGLSELPDKKTVAKLGQCWKPYSTIASWYLWRSLDLKP
jgi:DNA-3-methyladenine glycosylase II